MNTYITLFAAISLEVLGTMLLPASQNFSKFVPTFILLASYGLSFYLLAVISQKLSLAIIYASWSGLGIFSIAILSYIFYKQTQTKAIFINLNWKMTIILLIKYLENFRQL